MRILPVTGYRFSREAERDVSRVVAPPYDQIGPEAQGELYGLSPWNIVRVSYPRDEPGGDKYAAARKTLEAWLADGVWAPEAARAIYPYQQTYTAHGRSVTRTGFIALGEVSEYAKGIVLPHERTHAGPKRDRMQLLEATGADTGLLFMLITDPAAIARAQSLMAAQRVIIADGHHRYETAVEYARRHPGARYKLMAFFTLEAPGLTIVANHRLVHHIDNFDFEDLMDVAARWFDASPLADPVAFRPENRALGVVAGRDAVVLRLRPDRFDWIKWPDGTSRVWRGLAMSILHEGVLRPLLGITDEMLDARTHVDYTSDQAEAVRLAREGVYRAAFLIASTTPEELEAVVRGGELLPQKSTHFYPKLLDGLVFHKLGE